MLLNVPQKSVSSWLSIQHCEVYCLHLKFLYINFHNHLFLPMGNINFHNLMDWKINSSEFRSCLLNMFLHPSLFGSHPHYCLFFPLPWEGACFCGSIRNQCTLNIFPLLPLLVFLVLWDFLSCECESDLSSPLIVEQVAHACNAVWKMQCSSHYQ